MKGPLTLLVWLAVIAGGGVTAVANFQYGWMVGHGMERWVYAIGATVLDVVKTFLPTLMGTFLVGGLTLGTFFRHVVGWAIWLLGVVLSLWCAQGLYAATLDAKNAEAEGTKSSYSQWVSDRAAKEARIKVLDGATTREAQEGELAARKLDRLWSRSKECQDATAAESRAFCQDVARITSAISTARTAEQIRREREALQREIDKLTEQIGGTNQTDLHTDAAAGPKAQAKLLGWSVDFTTAFVALLLGLGFEGVGLLPWITMGSHTATPVAAEPAPSKKRREPALDAPVAEPAPAVAPTPISLPEEEGLVARWARTSLVRRKGSYTLAGDVRADFEAYCRAHGEPPLNPTAFGKEMTRLEFGRRKVGGQLRYVDIAVLPKQRELKVVASN
jgi:hypothetical protein